MICPICHEEQKDLLRHLVIKHKLKNRSELKDGLLEGKLRSEFGKYVDILKEKNEKGEITNSEFRELTIKWWDDKKNMELV